MGSTEASINIVEIYNAVLYDKEKKNLLSDLKMVYLFCQHFNAFESLHSLASHMECTCKL